MHMLSSRLYIPEFNNNDDGKIKFMWHTATNYADQGSKHDGMIELLTIAVVYEIIFFCNV